MATSNGRDTAYSALGQRPGMGQQTHTSSFGYGVRSIQQNNPNTVKNFSGPDYGRIEMNNNYREDIEDDEFD